MKQEEIYLQICKTYLTGYGKEVTIGGFDWINECRTPIYICQNNPENKYLKDGIVLWGSEVDWDVKYNLYKKI
jgi:hypothetical protein